MIVESKDILHDHVLECMLDKADQGELVCIRHGGRIYQIVPLPPDTESTDKRISVEIDITAEMEEALCRIALERGISVNQLISDFLDEYLKQHR